MFVCCLTGMVSKPIGAQLGSHTGLHCAYQLVIKRQAPWDLLLILQGYPGARSHPTIRRCSAFLYLPALISANVNLFVITTEALRSLLRRFSC